MQDPDEDARKYSQPHIHASIHMLGQNWGLGKPLATGSESLKFFSCPLIVNDHGYDCRVYLDPGQCLDLGSTTHDLPIRFLCPELVMPQLQVGTLFHLWGAKVFAYGHVEKICEVSE